MVLTQKKASKESFYFSSKEDLEEVLKNPKSFLYGIADQINTQLAQIGSVGKHMEIRVDTNFGKPVVEVVGRGGVLGFVFFVVLVSVAGILLGVFL